MRTALRNGTRPKTLATTAGDLNLRISKTRTGSFYSSLLERRRRIDRALFAVMVEAYVHGVFTRTIAPVASLFLEWRALQHLSTT